MKDYEEFLDTQIYYIDNHFGVEMLVAIDPVKNTLTLDSYPNVIGELAGCVVVDGGLFALEKFIQDITMRAKDFTMSMTEYGTDKPVSMDSLGAGAVDASLDIRNKLSLVV